MYAYLNMYMYTYTYKCIYTHVYLHIYLYALIYFRWNLFCSFFHWQIAIYGEHYDKNYLLI